MAFLTLDSTASLIINDPCLDAVYTCDSSKKNSLVYLFNLGLTLRKEKFDVVINLSNTLRTQFLTLLALPKRILTRNKSQKGGHVVQNFFASALAVFPDLKLPTNLSLHLNKKTLSDMENKLKQYPRPFWIVNPAGENAHLREGRIWSLKNWEALGTALIKHYGGTIFVVGSKNEQAYHKPLQAIPHCVVYSGKLSLEESAALFSMADLFISGDSGPLHIASSLGVYTLGIMGSTPASACGPYGSLAFAINPLIACQLTCRKLCTYPNADPLYKPCIESIKPEAVLDFIETKLWDKLKTERDKAFLDPCLSFF